MASIRDVAKLANVSPATVSRVMNGTAKVDDEKRERVMKAIEETGFVPNEIAKSLFKKTSKTIGLLIPDVENPFFAKMAHVVERAAEKVGYRIVLCCVNDDYEKEKNMIQMLTNIHADGLIIASSDPRIRELVENCTMPVVVTDRLAEKLMTCDFVHSNHYEGGRMAAMHLIQNGCKNIVCMIAGQQKSSAKARYDGYRDVCREYGMPEQVVECEYNFSEGDEKTELLLKNFPHVDGIIACNDMVAISVIKVLNRHHIRIPEDVQLIGFDDIQVASLITPALTTIAQPVDEIGKKAVELILAHGQDKEMSCQEYIYDVKLQKRETTK